MEKLTEINYFSLFFFFAFFSLDGVRGGWKREMLAIEKDFDSKLVIEQGEKNVMNKNNGGNSNVPRSKSFAFRAPQANFTIQDFELSKIYGVGSYSKVPFFLPFPSFFRAFTIAFPLALLISHFNAGLVVFILGHVFNGFLFLLHVYFDNI